MDGNESSGGKTSEEQWKKKSFPHTSTKGPATSTSLPQKEKQNPTPTALYTHAAAPLLPATR